MLCFLQRNFVCRSAEYNYVTLQCRLSDYDRRTVQDNLQPVTLVEAQGVDYFENLCLSHENACAKERSYQLPRFGIPAQKVAAHVKTQFYVDKELIVSNHLIKKKPQDIMFRAKEKGTNPSLFSRLIVPTLAVGPVELKSNFYAGPSYIWDHRREKTTIANSTTWITGPYPAVHQLS